MNEIGSAILEAAKTHCETAGSDPIEIEVPEWSDGAGPAKLYFRRTVSLQDKGAIVDAFQRGTTPGVVEFLIRRARDADGRLLWLPRHRTELARIDGEVTERIVDRVRAETASPTVEDAMGNSGATPSS